MIVVSLCLRFWHIDRESLWLDEGYTLLFSRLPLRQLIVVGGAHEHPPLYYLVVHVLLGVRDSYLIPRAVSAVAGSLSVGVIYLLGVRLYGLRAGLCAAILLLLSPFHVWYGQDGRAYEMAGLFVLLSYLFILQARIRSGPGPWVFYVGATLLALYTEYTTLLALLPQVLLLVGCSARTRSMLLRSWGAIGLGFSPWLGVVLLDAKSIAGTYWIPPPNVNGLVSTAMEFVGLRGPCPSPPCIGPEAKIPVIWGHEPVVALAGCILALGALLWSVLRRNIVVTVLVAWILLPFVLVLMISIWWSLYLDRVFLDATFPLYILLGAVVGRKWAAAPLIGISLVVAVSVGSAATLSAMQSGGTNPDWRPAARDLASAYRSGQAVAYVPAVLQQIVTAYAPGSWRPDKSVSLWYHAYLDVPGWQSRYWTLTDAELRDRQLTDLARHRPGIWLISQDYVGLNDTRRWFETHGYHLAVSEIYGGDTRLELWDREPLTTGGRVVLDGPSLDSWRRSGRVSSVDYGVNESGNSEVSHDFPVKPGKRYTVGLEYRSLPPASPGVQVNVYDIHGRLLSDLVDRFDHHMTGFPRTEWYDLPATGAWTRQPFGFVAPPGSVRATLIASNHWGYTSWRSISVSEH